MKPVPPRSYADIIDLPRPTSARHKPMPALARAAQFAPFAALSGFEDSLDETARLTDHAPQRTEEDAARLSARLHALAKAAPDRPAVTLEIFRPDERKPGGAMYSLSGVIRRVDECNRLILLEDGRTIEFDDVFQIAYADENLKIY